MKTEDYEGLQVCDKAILFSIIACCIIAFRYQSEVFLNFAIGFSIGGCFWYWAIIWVMAKKAKRRAKQAYEEAKKSQEKFDQAFEEKFGRKPSLSEWIKK